MAVPLAGSLCLQTIALGANGAFLSVAAATLNIVIAIGIILLLGSEWNFWRKAVPALILILVLIAWTLIPSVVLATGGPPQLRNAAEALPAPDLLLPGLVRLLGDCAILIGAAAIGYRRRLARITIDWLIALGAVQMIVGLLLREYDPQHVWGFSKTIDHLRFTGTMVNANANATVAGTIAILAFARCQTFLREGPPNPLAPTLLRALCVMTGFAASGICLLTGSRTMLMLLPPVMLALLLLDPVFRGWISGMRGKILIALALAGAIGLLCAFGDTTIGRFRSLGGDGIDRAAIWRHYAIIAARSPLFGYGAGAFTEMNGATLTNPADAVSFSYINSAHNELIETVIERGWIGTGLILLIGGVIVWSIVRLTQWRRDDPVIRAIPAALIIILTEAMIDIALDVPAIATSALTLLGLLWGRSLRRAHEKTRSSPVHRRQ